jgi:hypothetical protein
LLDGVRQDALALAEVDDVIAELAQFVGRRWPSSIVSKGVLAPMVFYNADASE